MQWIKSRICDITDDKLRTDFLKFKVIQTPQMARNDEISVCFLYLYVTHHHNFEIQTALVSKQMPLLSWKVVNIYKFSTSYAWWG